MHSTTRLKQSKFLWGLSLYVPIVSLYFLNHQVSLSAIVLSQVFYSIFSLIGDIPTGILADKIGKRQALMLGYLFNVFGFSFMLFQPNILGLYITYSLIGFGDSFLSGSEEALLYENSETPVKYRKNYSSLLSLSTLAFAIGTLVAGLVVAHFGQVSYRYLILSTLIADLLAAIIVSTIKKSNDLHRAPKHRASLSLLIDGTKIIKKNQILLALTVVSILTLSGEYFLYSVYQPYFLKFHVEPIFLGLVMSLGALLNFFVFRYSYLLERKFSLEKIILILNVSMGLAYIAMAYLVSPFALIGLFIVLKGLFNSQAPIISDYVNEYTPSHIRATVLSMMSVVKTFGQIILRVLLAIAVGAFGIGRSLEIQGLYLVIGTIIGFYILVQCGCTHRIKQHFETTQIETTSE